MREDVARLFDAQAGDAEVLEPWYEHLYGVLHGILDAVLAPPPGVRPGRALDAGCGTGLQTARLAALGYAAHGVDIAGGALAVARRRAPGARLARAGVEALPYPDRTFAAATCCGSTLSFVEAPARALAELGRVLAPGGRLLLECEHRWSLDLLWALASAACGDRLGYGTSLRAAARALAPGRGPLVVDYPGYGALRLFTVRELTGMLAAAGLAVRRAWGIHVLTNALPSTVLHRPRLGRRAAALYAALSALDDRLRRRGLGTGLANSVVLLAERITP